MYMCIYNKERFRQQVNFCTVIKKIVQGWSTWSIVSFEQLCVERGREEREKERERADFSPFTRSSAISLAGTIYFHDCIPLFAFS